MYANVLQFTKEPEMAKDLAQEIFLKIWSARETLPEIKAFRSYLYRVAKNSVLDTLRKRVLPIDNEAYLLDYLDDTALLPDSLLEVKELEADIHRAVAHLPEQVRTAFTLKRVEGLSHEHIGSRMNISAITSRSYITRAAHAIRQYLEQKRGRLLPLLWVIANFF